jgi:hypothetical protein
MDRRRFIASSAALLSLACTSPARAGQAHVFTENGVAIRGADAVAYFRGLGPVAGTISERVRWRGAVWLFATREHRDAFERDPRRFAPRFGGYCAYTLSQGALAPIDPRAYKVHRGRLYLLHSREKRTAWMRNLERNIKLAEENWPGALG